MLSTEPFLPGGDAAALRAFFGDRLGGVRLSISDRPRDLGCLAVASGKPGGCRTGSARIGFKRRSARLRHMRSPMCCSSVQVGSRQALAPAPCTSIRCWSAKPMRSPRSLPARTHQQHGAVPVNSSPHPASGSPEGPDSSVRCVQPVVRVGHEIFRKRKRVRGGLGAGRGAASALEHEQDRTCACRVPPAHLGCVTTRDRLSPAPTHSNRPTTDASAMVDRLCRALLGRVRSTEAAGVERRLAIRVDGSRRGAPTWCAWRSSPTSATRS